ncbi:hypothetical protein B0T24DRAFT_593503 [Lasiosphaeria ovina]|uniref:Pentatricopeptide repeat domain-containing protein n=1 Tax=Lasiosphaeria ovina TaxID=92902 RepID=A0AAE0KC90_9PEZI|nr:hypothetical protein B0T24DRAFT_593503 [Lasiosphaeria ovina]
MPLANAARRPGLSLIPRGIPGRALTAAAVGIAEARAGVGSRTVHSAPQHRNTYRTAPVIHHSNLTAALVLLSPPRQRQVPDQDAPTLLDRLAPLPIRPHGELESVFVEPYTKYPSRQETERHEQLRLAQVKAQIGFQLDRRRRDVTRDPDWRVTLWFLKNSTRDRSGRLNGPSAVRVHFTKDSTPLLISGDGGKNGLWNLASRTGCQVTLHSGQGEQDGPFLFLSGPPDRISSAVSDILAVTKSVLVVAVSGDTEDILHDGGQMMIPPLELPAEQGSDHAPNSYIHDPLPEQQNRRYAFWRPKTWTKESFERYVTFLIYSLPPAFTAPAFHADEVVHELISVFELPAASQFVSDSAFNLALVYMVRKTDKYRGAIRIKYPYDRLHARARKLGLSIDTQVHNLLLEPAVTLRNLKKFKDGLWKLVRAGHAPDFQTWMHFLRMFAAEEVKRYIIHAMYGKGFLRTQDEIRELAQEMAELDIYRSIQLGHSMTSFLAAQDALYGPGWLTKLAAEKILDILGRHGRFHDMEKFLEIMDAQSVWTNSRTLMSIIGHCKLQSRLETAYRFVELFSRYGITLSKTAFKLLFHLAWSRGKPHTLSVIFRYALWDRPEQSGLQDSAGEILTCSKSLSRFAWQILRRPVKVDNTDFLKHLLRDFLLDDLKQGGVKDMTISSDTMKTVYMWYRQRHREFEPVTPFHVLLRESLKKDDQLSIKAATKGFSWEPAGGEEPALTPIHIRIQKRENPLNWYKPMERTASDDLAAADKPREWERNGSSSSQDLESDQDTISDTSESKNELDTDGYNNYSGSDGTLDGGWQHEIRNCGTEVAMGGVLRHPTPGMITSPATVEIDRQRGISTFMTMHMTNKPWNGLIFLQPVAVGGFKQSKAEQGEETWK